MLNWQGSTTGHLHSQLSLSRRLEWIRPLGLNTKESSHICDHAHRHSKQICSLAETGRGGKGKKKKWNEENEKKRKQRVKMGRGEGSWEEGETQGVWRKRQGQWGSRRRFGSGLLLHRPVPSVQANLFKSQMSGNVLQESESRDLVPREHTSPAFQGTPELSGGFCVRPLCEAPRLQNSGKDPVP